jgi:uncharacterized protein (TIGR02246 family)
MKLLLAVLTGVFLSTFHALAETAPALPADDARKTARAQEDGYAAAFNRQDLKALEAFYAENVQFTTEYRTVISGRAAVTEGLGKYFAGNKEAKLEVTVESARWLTPEVLSEKGVSTVVTAGGNRDTTRYTSILVKKGDQWQIAQIEESAVWAVDPAAQALDQLEWLVGSWKDESPEITVESTVAWTKSNHFLRRSFSVTRDGAETIEGTEVIGYDPIAGQLRSWVFDSRGGFGEGAWRQEGDRWLVSVKATGPDGASSTAQHVIAKISDNKYTWESLNRTRNGEVLPNLKRIDVVRVP